PYTGVTRHFEPAAATAGVWWLTRVEDRNHNHVTLERDADDTLLEVTHSGGYRIRVGTAQGGPRITGLYAVTEDGPVRLRGFLHDESGNLTEVRNAADAPTRFTYDSAHRITGWRDSNDTVFTYVYDVQGRVVETHGSEGILNSRIAYGDPDADGTTTVTYTDSLGHATTYRANRRGQIVAITDPLGNTTTQTWDDRDHLLTRTDPLGRTTRWEWDAAGDLVSVTTPDGTASRVTYNDLHLPVRITDPQGATQLQTFDERGNCTSRTAPDGAVHRFTHHPTGAVAGVVNPLGDTLRVDADAAGLPLALEDAHGTRTTYRRDAYGRTIAVTDPLGATTTLVWDAEGRLLRRDSPDGTSESWTYDGEGSCTGHTDPLGHRTRLRHGPFDLLAAQLTPDGAEHRFRYDTEQRLTEVTNPLGLQWSYTYDAAGRLAAQTDFDGRTTRYSYDAAGQPVARTNAAGETITYAYDSAGRLVAKDVSGERTEYAYDAAGRLTEAVSASSRLTRVYDAAGRMTAETVDGRTTHYRYDALGRRTGRVTPTGAATETVWDEFGNRSGLRLDGDHRLAFDHDPLGREIRRTLGDHVALDSGWDSLGRLASHTLSTGHGPLRRREFGYRADGQPVSVTDRATGRAVHYELDPIGRPLAATGPRASETYTYDAAGNQTHAAWAGTPVDADSAGERTFDGTRVLTAGRVTYRYDAAGRLVERRKKRLSRPADVWRYTWNAEDRLTTCTTPDGVTWHYSYDALGRRTAKYRLADDGVTRIDETCFSWDGSRLAEERQHGGGAVLTWEYDGHRPLAQYERRAVDQDRVDARFFAIVTDLVGAPTELVDERGTLAWRSRSTVWGTTAYNSDATAYTPLRHPGQYADSETGLHYNYFRHYDPETARYTSPDPLGLTPAPNPLAYVTNPQTWSDPLGLTPCVHLYHATNRAGERSIRTHGIDPSFAPRPMDFGNGFYTTRSRQQAEEWARMRFGDDGVVLHFKVPAHEFEALNRRSFTENDPELSDFVRHFRAGDGTEVPKYDVVDGPMLRNVKAFMKKGAVPRWSGDQVVFFGDTGSLLDRALQ
ncbi:RHS repeat-associated core domain-containing protein, partial [Streptomyces sp. NPDC001135]